MIWAEANRMMDHHPVLLHLPGGLPDNVDRLYLLRHAARNAVQGRQLANAVGRDEAAGPAGRASIAVSGIGGVQSDEKVR